MKPPARGTFGRGLPGLTLLSLVMTTALPAVAQPMYRCGNTYSQTPCEAGAPAVRVHRDAQAAPASAPGAGGKALCRQRALEGLDLPPAQAAALEVQVSEPRYEMIRIGREPVAARRFDVVVNLRGPQGRIDRLQAAQCVLSEDELRLLDWRTR